MAEDPLAPFEFDDTKPPALLGKMDALIARHRGSGPDLSVPVLTDLAPAAGAGAIPVLTEVDPIIGDELMFTPEEIRPDDFAPPPEPSPPAPVPPAPPVAAKPAAAPAAPHRQAVPELPDLIDVPTLKPVAAPAAPAPVAAAPDFDFPDLTIPGTGPGAAKPANPAAPVVPPPAVGAPLMPDLALNFDFAVPDEKPAAAPVAPPVATAAAPAAKVVAPPAPAAAPVPVSDDVFDGLGLSIEAPPLDEYDAAAMVEEVQAALKPELEKLVRAELARQLAPLHVEALRRTLAVLQPQLQKFIVAKVDEAIKRR